MPRHCQGAGQSPAVSQSYRCREHPSECRAWDGRPRHLARDRYGDVHALPKVVSRNTVPEHLLRNPESRVEHGRLLPVANERLLEPGRVRHDCACYLHPPAQVPQPPLCRPLVLLAGDVRKAAVRLPDRESSRGSRDPFLERGNREPRLHPHPYPTVRPSRWVATVMECSERDDFRSPSMWTQPVPREEVRGEPRHLLR